MKLADINEATDTVANGKFIIIGNPGYSRPSALYPETEAPKLYAESDARRICDKLNEKPFGTPAPVAHWHYKGLDVALDYVSGSKAGDAIRKLRGDFDDYDLD